MYSQWDSNGDIEMPVPPMTPEELQRIIEYFSIQKPGPALIGPARTSLRPDLYPGGKFINGLYQPNIPPAQVGSGILVDPVTGQDINPPPSTIQNIPLRQRGNFNPQTPTGPQTISSPPISQPVSPQVSQSPKPYFSDLSNIPTQQDQPSASQDIKEILAAQGGPGGPAQGAVTPEKTNADDREKRLRRLEAFRGIAEGLGSIATGFERASLIRAGLNPSLAQPYIAETLRKRIEDLEDYATPAEQQALNIKPGVRRSTLRMVSPYLGMPYRAESLGLSKKRLEFEKEKEGRISKQAQTRLDRLTPAAWTQVQGTITGINAIKRVRSEFENLKNEIGPIQGRIKKALISVGAGDDALSVLNANTIDALAQYVRSISGAQVHVSEFNRLKNVYPNITQNPEQFDALLKNMEEVLVDRYNMILDLEESQNKNVESTRSLLNKMGPGEPGKTTPSAQYNKKVKIDGVIYPASDESIEKLKKDGIIFEEVQ